MRTKLSRVFHHAIKVAVGEDATREVNWPPWAKLFLVAIRYVERPPDTAMTTGINGIFLYRR